MAYGKGKTMKLGKRGAGAKRGSGGVRTPFLDRIMTKGGR